MSHTHDIDGMLADDRSRFTAYQLRLHLDAGHDAPTAGFDFARLHALHQGLHDPHLAEIDAAANLIAERLANAEPEVVESVFDEDAIARGAELARAFNAAGRALKMSEGRAGSSDTPGEESGPAGRRPSPGAPVPRHVWTCALKGGADTCECEAYANS